MLDFEIPQNFRLSPEMFAVPSAQAEQGGLTSKTSADNKKKRVPISWNSLEKKWR